MPQGGVPDVHVPDSHVSAPLQKKPSEHELPSGRLASAGQLLEVPSHISATSQLLAAGRQVVPLGCF